jgi:hypothetical protein
VPISLVSLTVEGATQIDDAPENWAVVKNRDSFVVIEAITGPNNSPDEWGQIRWLGDIGSSVAGYPNRRRLSCAASSRFHLIAACGGIEQSVDLWVVWAKVDVLVGGTCPPGAAPFPPGIRDDSQRLGPVTYRSFFSTTIDETTGASVNHTGASGKIVAVATISPAGLHSTIKGGWSIERKVQCHEWTDRNQRRFDTAAIPDTSKPSMVRLIPDSADRIYDTDAPDTRPTGQWSFETYNNFIQWVTWNGAVCSEAATWHWQARWRFHPNPLQQTTLNELGRGRIPLPDARFFTVLSRFDLADGKAQAADRVPGGDSFEATLVLYEPAAAGGVDATVASDHPNEVSAESPVRIPAGRDRATLMVTTQPVDADVSFMLSATVFGPGDLKYAGGTVKAAQIASFVLPGRTPAKKRGNIATIALIGRAGPHTQVRLNVPFPPIVDYPALVDVPRGATKVEFKYESGDVPGDRAGSIVASLNGSIFTAWTTVVKS